MKRAWKTLAAVVAAVCAGALLRTCVASSYLIPSTGMENSLYCGERIVVNKWSYGLRLPFMQWWGYHRWGYRPVEQEDIIVFNNPGNLQQPIVSRREAFIGRCIGTPGDTLLVDSLFNPVSSERLAPDQKFLYAYPRACEARLDSLLTALGIRSPLLGSDSTRHIRGFSRYEHYLLEQAADTSLHLTPQAGQPEKLYPLVIPGRGRAVKVRPWNRTLLCNTLLLHEALSAKTITGSQPTTTPTCPTRASSASCRKTTSSGRRPASGSRRNRAPASSAATAGTASGCACNNSTIPSDMNTVLLSTAYLAPVEYYAKLYC